jgi:hypothetical protein
MLFVQIAISFALGIIGLIILILGARWLSSGSLASRLSQYVESPTDK